MPNNLHDELCVSCGAAAAVRVTGTSFCASCGLRQHQGAGAAVATPSKSSHRGAFMGILSTGLLVKMLMGAVALAAVGGMATSLRSESVAAAPDSAPVVTTTDLTTPTSSGVVTIAPAIVSEVPLVEGEAPVASTEGQTVAVREYVVAVQAWAECVSGEAAAHTGGAFDPVDVCSDQPKPGDFGLDDWDGEDAEEPPGHDEDGPGNSENAPGHDDDGPGNSENAPGHDDSDDDDGDDDDGDDDDDDDDDKKPPKEKDE